MAFLLLVALSLSTKVFAQGLVVNGASIIVNDATNMFINNGSLLVSSGSFTLNNNANLIQNQIGVSTSNTGNIIVRRNSSTLYRLDYTVWSSPVLGSQTLGNFSPLTSTNRFYEYNTTSDLYSAVSNGIPFGLAKGYLIRMPNEDPANLGLGTPYYIGNSALTYNGVFAGTPNNGDITYTMSTVGNGYNAVGNPYPSTLNMDNFISGNSSNITGPLYFWRKRNDALNGTSYSTCTTAGCALNNGHSYPNADYISVGQGFIVKALTTTLNFTNSMRIADNTNQFFKTKAIEKNRIWLNLSDATSPINQMMVAYMTGATQGIDAAIDGKYFNDSQTALNSLIGNEEFAIQGRSLPFEVTDVVPLAFKTTTTGNYTISIDRVDGLFTSGQEVYLVDSKTGAETNLKTSSYNFTAASGVDNARFSLKYQKTLKVDAPVFNENSVTVFKNSGVIYVNSKESIINNIKVYDVQGRLLAEQNDVKANTATINNLKATQQILIVKVTSEDNKVISKKVAN